MHRSNIIIGVCGLKRCGKDTIADYLVANYGFVKLKFATPLKAACRDLFGFTDDQLETDAKEEVDPLWNITPRHALQFMGTEIMQHKINELLPSTGKLFWVKKMMHQINMMQENRVVISDLRFMHEYDHLKATYGDRFKVLKIQSSRSLSEDAHVSEREWKQIPHNHLINNSKTLNDLYAEIDMIFNQS
jgi:hypothetical protein